MSIVRWILSIGVLLIIVGGASAILLVGIQAIKDLKLHTVVIPGRVLMAVGGLVIASGMSAIVVLKGLKLLVF